MRAPAGPKTINERRNGEPPLPGRAPGAIRSHNRDRVRLGDADLWVKVAEDRTARGDEPTWGCAKNLRSRMTQWDVGRAGSPAISDGSDLVVGPNT